MNRFIFNLQLFSEGSGGSAGGTGAAAEGNRNSAGAGNLTGNAATGQQVRTTDGQNTVDPKERETKFRELIRGEYKDLYTKETQNIIDRRFRETKQLEQYRNDVTPLIDMLNSRYGTTDIAGLMKAVQSDSAIWEAMADSQGLTVEQFMTKQRLEAENANFRRMMEDQQRQQKARATYQQWLSDAEEVKQVYPGFDLAAESANPEFVALLQRGIPVKLAYEVLHMEDIKAGAATAAQQAVAASVRANGMRPSENGASAQSGIVTGKVNPADMTKEQRRELARRAARGEIITLK